jgi:DNA-binding response OmpR family regulator
LVLEDNLLTRHAISEALRHDGFKVLESYDARQAMEILRTIHVDVLFADLNLPSDDEGLIAALYAQIQQPGVRVILTSVRRREEDGRMDDYFGPFIQKPYLITTVVRLIRDNARRRSTERTLPSHPLGLPPILWND